MSNQKPTLLEKHVVSYVILYEQKKISYTIPHTIFSSESEFFVGKKASCH